MKIANITCTPEEIAEFENNKVWIAIRNAAMVNCQALEAKVFSTSISEHERTCFIFQRLGLMAFAMSPRQTLLKWYNRAKELDPDAHKRGNISEAQLHELNEKINDYFRENE
jgi:hypothetical protein